MAKQNQPNQPPLNPGTLQPPTANVAPPPNPETDIDKKDPPPPPGAGTSSSGNPPPVTASETAMEDANVDLRRSALGVQKLLDKGDSDVEVPDNLKIDLLRGPIHYNGNRLSRLGMEQTIARGGTVLHNGVVYGKGTQLPEPEELASSETDLDAAEENLAAEEARLAARRKNMDRKRKDAKAK